MIEKEPQSVHKIIPVELALVEFTDGANKTSYMLAAIASNISELSPTDPNLSGAVKVIDWMMPDGKWRNTGGVSVWLAKGIQKLIKEQESSNDVETNQDSLASI